MRRRKTKIVNLGGVKIGGRHPVSIQSMTKTNTADIQATVKQIRALEDCGCQIIRVAVRDRPTAAALDKIKSRINIPLVADIHFDYRLGLEAIARGVDALRLNPGNIYRREQVKAVAGACKRRKIPIRVGVNSGSIRSVKRKAQGAKLKDLMVESALDYIKLLESFNFYDIIVSLKSSDAAETVEAYQELAAKCRYPFHLGVTAAGLPEEGRIKSAIGIGSLLLAGIGDTIRVSLAGNPLEEIKAAKQILEALGLRSLGPQLMVCPTCGRCQTDVIKIAQKLAAKLNHSPFTIHYSPKVAIMGCEVNGPGEARHADIGIACGKKSAVLFKKGRIIRKVKEGEIVSQLLKELQA